MSSYFCFFILFKELRSLDDDDCNVIKNIPLVQSSIPDTKLQGRGPRFNTLDRPAGVWGDLDLFK